MATDARALFRDGNLDGAIEAVTGTVRDNPNDSEARALLADFQCFAGAFDKADRQLDIIGTQNTKLAVAVAQTRQVIRGAIARQEVFEKGRAPDVVTEPDGFVAASLQALLALREGDGKKAQAILAEAEEQRIKVTGKRDGDKPFDDFRDADDLSAGILEVISVTGKYFWVPMHKVVSIRFENTARPRDLLWRPASVEVRDGPEGVVYIPATYPTTPTGPEATALRLGRATDWQGSEGEVVRGVGLRLFVVGEDGVGIDELSEVDFETASA